jgi:hypothetical protein
MNDSSSRRLRQGCALAAAAGIAVLLAACGGASSSSGSGATPYEKALAYSKCMRAKGDPGYPDPNSQGLIASGPSDRDALSGRLFQTADKFCAKLAPAGVTAAQLKQDYRVQLKFAACMRTHGVPNFPDPKPDGYGFGHADVDYHSPGYLSADKTCDKIPAAEGL